MLHNIALQYLPKRNMGDCIKKRNDYAIVFQV